MHAVDRTLSIGERATDLMRAYSHCASPRAYELWYTYVTGLKPALNDAVKSLLGLQDKLGAAEIDRIYEEHLSEGRVALQALRAGSELVLEMDEVMSQIDAAAGSTAQFGASLEALSGSLAGPLEGGRLRGVIESLVEATREVADSNRSLEARLKDSRGEIDSLRKLLDDVRQESLTDALTGLFNRKHFEVTLTASVAAARADGSALTLVVIDIDEFKRFNDLYGHLTGDQVLRLVGAAMREHVDPTCTLARFGGEEFGMVLPGIGRDHAYGCAEKIRLNVMARELLKRATGESLGRITVSLGIAVLSPGETATSFLDRADRAMYRAKRSGRNRTVVDEDPAIPEAA
ncbi:GGDEF domain-containing protein [Enterovirga sp.]|jgi:diguanylate cyclase|uniref:GGDEF domain-containing protein n=1 Tax=Enterovirga sp. TaxID=2026350 RepID=UPI002638C738|nr:GGDEF domain-containing protein [Enterovirga sp.]MDB5590660.1 Diguanylate cyclase [Enterovirga sp.]